MSQDLTVDNQAQADEKVSCLIVPLNDKQLLIPNVTVAEIITYRQIIKSEYHNDWLLGQLHWRDTLIPVISYELMNGGISTVSPDARIAIINGIGNHRNMPFYAIVIQGIPRLVQISQHDIQEVEAMHSGAYDKVMVSLENQQVVIPNLDDVEQELLKYTG